MNFYPIGLSPLDAGISPSSRILYLEATKETDWGGRCQVGSQVAMEVLTKGAVPYSPTGVVVADAVPSVRIYSVSSPTRTYKAPLDNTSGGAVGVFRFTFVPGSADAADHHLALISYSAGGYPRAELRAFEVIAGGHASGSVNSGFSVSLPAGSSMIAHEESGRISLGLRAYLDRGD